MQYGQGPLHYAKTAEVVAALIKGKADIKLKDGVMCVCTCVGSGGGWQEGVCVRSLCAWNGVQMWYGREGGRLG